MLPICCACEYCAHHQPIRTCKANQCTCQTEILRLDNLAFKFRRHVLHNTKNSQQLLHGFAEKGGEFTETSTQMFHSIDNYNGQLYLPNNALRHIKCRSQQFNDSAGHHCLQLRSALVKRGRFINGHKHTFSLSICTRAHWFTEFLWWAYLYERLLSHRYHIMYCWMSWTYHGTSE